MGGERVWVDGEGVQEGLEIVADLETLLAFGNALTRLPSRAARTLASLRHVALMHNELEDLSGFEALVHVEKLCVRRLAARAGRGEGGGVCGGERADTWTTTDCVRFGAWAGADTCAS